MVSRSLGLCRATPVALLQGQRQPAQLGRQRHPFKESGKGNVSKTLTVNLADYGYQEWWV